MPGGQSWRGPLAGASADTCEHLPIAPRAAPAVTLGLVSAPAPLSPGAQVKHCPCSKAPACSHAPRGPVGCRDRPPDARSPLAREAGLTQFPFLSSCSAPPWGSGCGNCLVLRLLLSASLGEDFLLWSGVLLSPAGRAGPWGAGHTASRVLCGRCRLDGSCCHRPRAESSHGGSI